MTSPDTRFIGIMFAQTSNSRLAAEVSVPSSDLGLKRKRSPGGQRDRKAVSGRKAGHLGRAGWRAAGDTPQDARCGQSERPSGSFQELGPQAWGPVRGRVGPRHQHAERKAAPVVSSR